MRRKQGRFTQLDRKDSSSAKKKILPTAMLERLYRRVNIRNTTKKRVNGQVSGRVGGRDCGLVGTVNANLGSRCRSAAKRLARRPITVIRDEDTMFY